MKNFLWFARTNRNRQQGNDLLEIIARFGSWKKYLRYRMYIFLHQDRGKSPIKFPLE